MPLRASPDIERGRGSEPQVRTIHLVSLVSWEFGSWFGWSFVGKSAIRSIHFIANMLCTRILTHDQRLIYSTHMGAVIAAHQFYSLPQRR
jgi:hypothetical protein